LCVSVDEGIGVFARAIFAERARDELHPAERDRFVVAAFERFGDVVFCVEGLETRAHFFHRGVEGQLTQIEVREFDVLTVVPLSDGEREAFEFGEELVVGHGRKFRFP